MNVKESDELIALADRCFAYADGVVAFALVNGFAFLVAVLEPDVRCALVDNRGLVITAVFGLQLLYVGALLGLRRAEQHLRTQSKIEASEAAARFRRGVSIARLGFTLLVAIGLSGLCYLALSGGPCAVG